MRGEGGETRSGGPAPGSLEDGAASASAAPPVLEPGGEEEAAEILREASAEGRRVRVEGRGFRTSSSSASGEPADRVLSASAIRGIESFEPADLTMTVRPGTTLEEVEEAAAEEGLWAALDPPGGGQRSVGGAVAGGEYGPLHAGLGLPREQVLATRLVTGDGRRLPLGAPVVKNVAGFDLLKLLPGSRGRLGLVAAVTLRLHPRPPGDRTVLFRAPDPESGARMARQLMEHTVPVVALELLARCSEARGHPAALAVRVTGRERTLDALQGRLEAGLGKAAVEVLDGEASRRFFQEMARAEGEEEGPLRVAFLPAELPRVVRALEEAATGRGDPDPSNSSLRAHGLGGRLRLSGGLDRGVAASALSGHAGVGGAPPRATRAEESPEFRGSMGRDGLVERLRGVFDPEGALVDPGPPWQEVTP